MSNSLRIATRKSALALWQANHVAERLSAAHPDLQVELVPMTTRGDRILDRPLNLVGGKGLFLKELEVAMLEGRADLAVHSMKDVPAEGEKGLTMTAILERADHRDALVSSTVTSIDGLPSGARVGTSSLRRRCQLLALRSDLEIVDLRGNVDTRLRKLDQGDYDAIVLACAGLIRLDLADRIAAPLGGLSGAGDDWLSAPSQGAIGVQCRSDDQRVRGLCEVLHDPVSAMQIAAERAFAERLEGSCQVPLAAWARLEGPREQNGEPAPLRIDGLVGTPDGSCILRAHRQGDPADARELGLALGDELLERGAMDILRRLSP